MSRVVAVLKLSYLSSVGGDPLVPGLLIDLECASFWVQGGLRVHLGLVYKDAPASQLGGILFFSCRGGCVHSKSAANFVPEADYIVHLLMGVDESGD